MKLAVRLAFSSGVICITIGFSAETIPMVRTPCFLPYKARLAFVILRSLSFTVSPVCETSLNAEKRKLGLASEEMYSKSSSISTLTGTFSIRFEPILNQA